mmetsp:Transcript_14028/g.45058  ORF Transcript_14028/g.45058 Transcript_14028/m.45058 type:complete len:501 (-) Transcript_14028:579-2081(-)
MLVGCGWVGAAQIDETGGEKHDAREARPRHRLGAASVREVEPLERLVEHASLGGELAHGGVRHERAALPARLGRRPRAEQRTQRLGAQPWEGQQEGHEAVQLAERHRQHLGAALRRRGEPIDKDDQVGQVRLDQRLQGTPVGERVHAHGLARFLPLPRRLAAALAPRRRRAPLKVRPQHCVHLADREAHHRVEGVRRGEHHVRAALALVVAEADRGAEGRHQLLERGAVRLPARHRLHPPLDARHRELDRRRARLRLARLRGSLSALPLLFVVVLLLPALALVLVLDVVWVEGQRVPQHGSEPREAGELGARDMVRGEDVQRCARGSCRLDERHGLPAAEEGASAEEVVREQEPVHRALLRGGEDVAVAVGDPVRIAGEQCQELSERGHLARRLGVGNARGDRRVGEHLAEGVLVRGARMDRQPLREGSCKRLPFLSAAARRLLRRPPHEVVLGKAGPRHDKRLECVQVSVLQQRSEHLRAPLVGRLRGGRGHGCVATPR